jgi:hypothetical protein
LPYITNRPAELQAGQQTAKRVCRNCLKRIYDDVDEKLAEIALDMDDMKSELIPDNDRVEVFNFGNDPGFGLYTDVEIQLAGRVCMITVNSQIAQTINAPYYFPLHHQTYIKDYLYGSLAQGNGNPEMDQIINRFVGIPQTTMGFVYYNGSMIPIEVIFDGNSIALRSMNEADYDDISGATIQFQFMFLLPKEGE